ncbi:MAG: hypothetical protein Q8910_00420 [Bacteroidota bacterium]|nr:hypothetical protein [Bacteroidota bacterium]
MMLGNSIIRPQRKILFYDTYNRSNSSTTLGTSDSGQTYTYVGGTFGISSNRAYVASYTSLPRALVNINNSNCTLTGIVGTPATNMRFIFRYASSSNEWMVDISSTYSLFKRVSGTTSTAASTTVTPVSGDVVKLVLVGQQIMLSINNTLVANIFDTFNQDATTYGIGSIGTSNARWEELKIKSIA